MFFATNEYCLGRYFPTPVDLKEAKAGYCEKLDMLDDRIGIVTSAEPWSYEVKIPILSFEEAYRKTYLGRNLYFRRKFRGNFLGKKAINFLGNRYMSTPIALEIDLEIQAGEVAIATLEWKTGEILDETYCTKQGKQTIHLLLDKLENIEQLVVRNLLNGRPSELFITDIRGRWIVPKRSFLPKASLGKKIPLLPMANWNRFYSDRSETFEEELLRYSYNQWKGPQILSWLKKFRVNGYPENEISRALYLSGLYEPNSLLALKGVLRKGDCFLDIGANIGLYSLFAASCVGKEGRVLAFEPSPREFSRLQENLNLNRNLKIEPLQHAVSNKCGRGQMLISSDYHSGHNTIGDHFSYDTTETVDKVDVSLTTVDQIIQEERLQKVDCIKVDTEGGEYNVLLGAMNVLRRDRPILMLEVSENHLATQGGSVEKLQQLLTTLNYDCFGVDEDSAALVSLGKLPTGDTENVVMIPSEKNPEKS
ncbi:MAG: FkbM family methyltransferase [Pirellulaceae bacterium]|nr:FkbM family methyltransferase [Pirellulaceae bacterium]